jgi:hypothetical protein
MFVLKLPLLVVQQIVGELVLPVSSCLSVIILENKLSVYNKYGNFHHRHNGSPVHLHGIFGVGNFTKVVRVCAERL